MAKSVNMTKDLMTEEQRPDEINDIIASLHDAIFRCQQEIKNIKENYAEKPEIIPIYLNQLDGHAEFSTPVIAGYKLKCKYKDKVKKLNAPIDYKFSKKRKKAQIYLSRLFVQLILNKQIAKMTA